MKYEGNYFEVNENEEDAAANALLFGTTSSHEEDGLVAKLEPRKSELSVRFNLEETRVVDGRDNVYAFAKTTAYDDALSDDLLLSIDDVESFPPGKGYFSVLLEGVEEGARREGISALTLEVDEDNSNAIDIYRHKGFYETGSGGFVADGIDPIQMRKDLL